MKSVTDYTVLFILFAIQINGCLNIETKQKSSSDLIHHEQVGGAFNSKTNYDQNFPILGSHTPSPMSAVHHATLPSSRKTTLNMPVGSTAASAPTTNQFTRGRVRDLINVFDPNGSKRLTTTKQPSFSTILRGKGEQEHLPAGTGGTNRARSDTTLGIVATTKSPTRQVPKNNGPTDLELQALSEELLSKDTNNAAKYLTINYQEKTTSTSSVDKAPRPLLTIAPEVWNITTVEAFVPLLDNYERDTSVNEHVTAQERIEENTFMDAVMATSVMRHLMAFLKDKGYVAPDPKQQKDFVKQMWFGMYSRGKGKISSSGFEHVFVSELNRAEVSGLHNWIYYSKEEQSNRVNYLGYLKYLPISNKGAVIKLHYNQEGIDKPVGSMFIGTSPELEMALYTLCYVTRSDNICNLKLGTKDVNIVTYNFRYRSKDYIGSAYPQI